MEPRTSCRRHSGGSAVGSLEWQAGEPVPPPDYGPIQVQTTASVFHVSGVDSTAETFSCRLALHLQWIDMYYKRPELGEDEFDQYSTHPTIGTRRSRAFPKHDLSMSGESIPLDGRPRWTPELKFFGAADPPSIIRLVREADANPRPSLSV